MYYVYVLENEKGRHYIGITTDKVRRLNEHNQGSTASTKPFRPWRLIYSEQFLTRQEACKREWHLKHPRGFLEKKKIIAQFGEVA